MSYKLLLLLPFIGAIFTFAAGKLNSKLAFYFAQIIGITLFATTLNIFFNYTQPIDIAIEWFSFGTTVLPFGIYIDHLSLVMLLIATGLGMLDIHFSHDYMKEEIDQARYYAKVLFFIGGMILLVSAKELLGLFVGWEFMRLASYLLISFWHQTKAPADAGVVQAPDNKYGKQAKTKHDEIKIDGKMINTQADTEQSGRGYAGYAAGAERKVIPVLQDQPGNLTETEGDDG